jgi:hypothetical protein
MREKQIKRWLLESTKKSWSKESEKVVSHNEKPELRMATDEDNDDPLFVVGGKEDPGLSLWGSVRNAGNRIKFSGCLGNQYLSIF